MTAVDHGDVAIPSPRLLAAASAIVVAAILGAVVLATAEPDPARGTAVASWLLGGAAVALVAGLAWRTPAAIGAAAIGLGAAYAVVHVHAGTGVPASALVVAPGVLAVAELAAWSIDLAPPAAGEAGVHRPRAAWVALAVLGAGVLAAALATVAKVRVIADRPLDALAVAAALALLALIATLARR